MTKKKKSLVGWTNIDWERHFRHLPSSVWATTYKVHRDTSRVNVPIIYKNKPNYLDKRSKAHLSKRKIRITIEEI